MRTVADILSWLDHDWNYLTAKSAIRSVFEEFEYTKLLFQFQPEGQKFPPWGNFPLVGSPQGRVVSLICVWTITFQPNDV